MSTLYTITIKRIEDTKVTTEISVDHPDAGSDIGSKDFALQILLETGHIERPYFEKLPIPEEEWRKLVTEHPRKEEYGLMHMYNDGRKLNISEEEGKKREDLTYWRKHNEELALQYGMKVSSSGMSGGQYYVYFDNEPLKLIEAANKVVISKPVKRKLEKKLYTLEFEVADAEYLHHLREKMRYESAAYNLSAYHKFEVKAEQGEVVLLVYKDDKSDKFWQVVQDNTTLNITYGKTGTAGQKNVKEFDSVQKAEKERDKLINEKLGKVIQEKIKIYIMSLFDFFKNDKQDDQIVKNSTAGNPSAVVSREEMQDKLASAIDNKDFIEIEGLMNFVTIDNVPSIYLALNFEDAWFPGKGYDRIVKTMANNRLVDVNETKEGKTPLIMIAEACHNSTGIYALMVESLLDAGADPNKTDSLGWSALAYVINKHNVSPVIIQKLIDADSDLNLVVESDDFIGINKRSILGMAYYNSKDFFAQLKEKGATMTNAEIEELQKRDYPLEP